METGGQDPEIVPGDEDEEDRWIREGRAKFEAMTPEEQAEVQARFDVMFAKMQDPAVAAAVDRVFRASPDELRAIIEQHGEGE